jgi:hypothetical protein
MESLKQKLNSALHGSDKYKKLNLNFNPFPKSGTTNINSGTNYIEQLDIIDPNVGESITNFISQAFDENPNNPEDKFISAVIVGDYGVGKTQHLMFIKYLLETLENNLKPYVVYVDNPGVSLSALIGTIVSKIGEENFKKYLWSNIIKEIIDNEEFEKQLIPFKYNGASLFPGTVVNPYDDINTINYKAFLDAWLRYINNPSKRKEFNKSLKDTILQILYKKYNDSALSSYFYELIAADFGISAIWESMSSGTSKELNGKEVKLIKAIVSLIKEQGYTDFFILVDEFEDITKGRLDKKQIDNYVYNLRTLLDEHREWVLFFAMTSQALIELNKLSPAFVARIGSRTIRLAPFNDNQGLNVIKLYLSSARENNDSISPFTENGVKLLIKKTDGSPRRFLKSAYFLIEKLISSNGSLIDETFIENNLDSTSIP